MRRDALIGAAAAAIACAAPMIAWGRWHNAMRDAARVGMELSNATADAAEIRGLRDVVPWREAADPPRADLTPSVAEAIAASGGDPGVLRRVQQRSDREVSMEGVPAGTRLRTVSITLEPISLAQLGRFFEAWQAREPAWMVTHVELKRRQGASEGSVGLELACVYAPATQGQRR